MARIETSLHRDYCPTWKVWEGLREILQNALDAQDDGFPMEVVYHEGSGNLIVRNKDVTLDRKSMLMGYSSKRNSGARGEHGEGYKVGILALVRAGKPVSIRSGKETWKGGIHASKNYGGEEVFCFDTRTRETWSEIVEVVVGNVAPEEWLACQERVVPLLKDLFKGQDKDVKEVRGVSGAALFKHRELRGMLFVKDLFVCRLDGDYAYGYNLRDVKLDRDRMVPAAFDVKWETSALLRETIRQGNDLDVVGSLLDMLETETPELRESVYSGMNQVAEMGSIVAPAFRAKHGPDAHPVRSISEAQKMEHLGKKGVVVSETLKRALRDEFDEPEVMLKKHSQGFALVQLHDLSEGERAALTAACARIDVVVPGTSDRVVVGEFNDKDILGMWMGEERKLRLSRQVLTDQWECLKTLVHEACHDEGGDGDVGHVKSEEKTWANLVRVAVEGPGFLKTCN